MATRSTQRNLGRLSEIVQVAGKHGFGYFFETHRVGAALPFRRREELDGDRSQRGVHLREMLDELGPTFVKFGQALSMRPDVLPPDIIAELRRLQDDVKPFAFEQVEEIVTEELGLTVEQLFLEFEPTPVASASIGQVHRAVLPNGKRVAVKVQRPGAPRQIDADLALMMQAAKLVRERVKALEFVDPDGARRRVLAPDPPRARLPARGAQRRGVPPQLRGPPARRRAAGLLELHALARAHARAARGAAAGRHR